MYAIRSYYGDQGAAGRVLARVGAESHQRALAGLAGDLPVLVGHQGVARDELHVVALLARLPDDQAGLGVVAADVDDVDPGVLHFGHERRVVLLARRVGLVHRLLDAALVELLLGLRNNFV